MRYIHLRFFHPKNNERIQSCTKPNIQFFSFLGYQDTIFFAYKTPSHWKSSWSIPLGDCSWILQRSNRFRVSHREILNWLVVEQTIFVLGKCIQNQLAQKTASWWGTFMMCPHTHFKTCFEILKAHCSCPSYLTLKRMGKRKKLKFLTIFEGGRGWGWLGWCEFCRQQGRISVENLKLGELNIVI